MTSSGHETSSGSCPNYSPWALSYRLSSVYWNYPAISGFVSEIGLFGPKAVRKVKYYVMTSLMTS